MIHEPSVSSRLVKLWWTFLLFERTSRTWHTQFEHTVEDKGSFVASSLSTRTFVGVQYSVAVRAGVINVLAGSDEERNQRNWKEAGKKAERKDNTHQLFQL